MPERKRLFEDFKWKFIAYVVFITRKTRYGEKSDHGFDDTEAISI